MQMLQKAICLLKITNRNGRNAVCKDSPPCTDEIGEKGKGYINASMYRKHRKKPQKKVSNNGQHWHIV